MYLYSWPRYASRSSATGRSAFLGSRERKNINSVEERTTVAPSTHTHTHTHTQHVARYKPMLLGLIYGRGMVVRVSQRMDGEGALGRQRSFTHIT